MKGYGGSVHDVYDYVYVSSCYREFERKTLIRVFRCVEFSFSKLASEMFFVTMEYVNGKVSIFLPWPRKSFQYLFEICSEVAMST